MSFFRPALTWLLIWLLAFAAPAQAVQNMLLLDAALSTRAAKTGLIRDRVVDHNGDYGETLTEQGTVYNPFRWNGEQLDPESGLYYLRNRYYQPSTGRFMQRDPIGYEGGLNLYSFCSGDPVNASDPSGLDPWAEQAAKDLKQFRQEYHLPYATLERMYLQEAWENSAEGQGVLYQRLRGRAAVSGFVFKGAALPRGAGVPAAETPNLVYRGLAAGENPANGLTARAPGVPTEIPSHVAGKRVSSWISSSKSEQVAQGTFGKNGVVKIDLNKVPSKVVDISDGIPNMPKHYMLSRWAIKMQEVLIQDYVPPEAIVP